MEQRIKRKRAILLAAVLLTVLTGCESQAIVDAGYNTLLGMGMAFAILILISLVISLFPLIGGVGKGNKRGKEKEKEMRLKSIDKTISHIEKQENEQSQKSSAGAAVTGVRVLSGTGSTEEEIAAMAAAIAASEAEGPELIAVITAAIAAYEADTTGSVQPALYGPVRHRQIPVPPGYQGFYVRSIRKVGGSQWKNS